MNMRLKHMLLSMFLLVSFAATAQTSHVTVGGNVFGGGNLADVGGNSSVTINATAPSTGNNVGGDVYGGGALAHVNVITSGSTTTVTLTKGTVAGDVYGIWDVAADEW